MKMKLKQLISLAFLLSYSVCPHIAHATDLPLALFSAESVGEAFPTGWRPLTFRSILRKTSYSLVREAGQTVVLKSESSASASGLVREVEVDVKKTPFIRWRWKVARATSRNENLTTKEGDDCPARVLLGFGSFLGQPKTGIIYVWTTNHEKGGTFTSPSSKNIKVVVLQDAASIGSWTYETRNVYQDYRTLFHTEPPPLTSIAVMSDTDNTQGSATAYFGDIVSGSSNSKSR